MLKILTIGPILKAVGIVNGPEACLILERDTVCFNIVDNQTFRFLNHRELSQTLKTLRPERRCEE